MKLLQTLFVFLAVLTASQGSGLHAKTDANPFNGVRPLSCTGQAPPSTKFTDCQQFETAECPGLMTGCTENLARALVICCPTNVPGQFTNCPVFCGACGTGAKCFDLDLCKQYCDECQGTCSCSSNVRSCISTGTRFGALHAAILLGLTWIGVGMKYVVA